MAFNGKYEYDKEGIDHILSEKGDLFLALREIRWSPDKPFKLDLRHYKSDENGDITLKGCSFTDDDADELTSVLIKEGFGDNDELLDTITEYRPDLCRALKTALNSDIDIPEKDARVQLYERRMKTDEAESDYDEYYDPRRLLEE